MDFNHLGVSGGSAAHRLIGGVRVVTSGVCGKRRLDAMDLFVGAFNAPEASAANDHSFHVHAASPPSFNL